MRFLDGTLEAKDMTAIEQTLFVVYRRWADNAISVERKSLTTFVRPCGALERDEICFVLAAQRARFRSAPMGELTKEEREHVLSTTSPLGEKLSGSTIMSDEEFDAECATGACPVR